MISENKDELSSQAMVLTGSYNVKEENSCYQMPGTNSSEIVISCYKTFHLNLATC